MDYFTEPIFKKFSFDEASGEQKLSYGASSWCVTQESAYTGVLKLDKDTSLFGIYKGHGGHKVATYFAKQLPQFLKTQVSYKQGDFNTAMKEAYMELLEEVEREMREAEPVVNRLENEESRKTEDVLYRSKVTCVKEKIGSESGCSVVLSLLRGNTLYVANTGDCRCILSRQGRPITMSGNPKPEDDPEKSTMERVGGEVTENTQVNGGAKAGAIGDLDYWRVESIDLEEGVDFFVLACDGIWNSKSNQQAIDFIQPRLNQSMTLSKICEELFHDCLAPKNTLGDGTGCDSMTAIIVRLERSLPGDQIDTTSTTQKRPLPVEDSTEGSRQDDQTKRQQMDESDGETSSSSDDEHANGDEVLSSTTTSGNDDEVEVRPLSLSARYASSNESKSDEDQLEKAEKAKSNQDDYDKVAKKKQKFGIDEACGSNLKSSVLTGPSVSTILSDTDTSGDDEVQPTPPSESQLRGQESMTEKWRSLCPLGFFQNEREFDHFQNEMAKMKKSQHEEMKARIKEMVQSQTEEV